MSGHKPAGQGTSEKPTAGVYCAPKICMPRREKMVMMSVSSTSRLLIWGRALPNVDTILYSPFHERISRSMRSTRSMRMIRKNERFAPPPAKRIVRTISRIDMHTMVPSSWFHPSAQ